MQFNCPYCQHKVNLKEPKAGKFSPKCPKCAKKFSLTVPADLEQPPLVAAIASEQSATTETIAPPSPADSTGAWQTKPAPSALDMPTMAQPTMAAKTARAGAPAESTGAWNATQAGGASDATMAQPSGGTTASGGVRAGGSAATQVGNDATMAAPGASSQAAGSSDMPATLGGYQLVKELGRGGMGSVYLAKQVSLDRDVALKVMQPQWAKDPAFVARFTREAYAAAQLVHHNVVQIYDIGAERDMNFFSMEFVRGQSLSDLVKKDGKLDPEMAVGYVLQAARGLKFAHDQGLIHRDIKPDNLMINDQGIVKVADLGLVKKTGVADIPASEDSGGKPAKPLDRAKQTSLGAAGDITMANVAMGTPAYMSPEQSTDAASVDHRADIYSLGCTLYVLLTGQPPFSGKTAFEVMSKHQTEPMVPPEVLVKRVPKEVSGIILKMTAKKKDDRYANLGECISALEEFLGIKSGGAFTPKEEHANTLEGCVKRFNACSALKVRTLVLLGFAGACLVLALGATLFGAGVLGGGFLGLGLMTLAAYFVVNGLFDKTHLFMKARELVLGSSWGDWALWAVGFLLFAIVLWLFGLHWMWLGFSILAVGLAFAVQFTLNKKAKAERAATLEETELMLRNMRLMGLDEQALRQFVCKYAGDQWEEFYEALFGYEAKIEARAEFARGERGKARSKHGAWREPIVNWIEAKQRARKESRERAVLQKIEEKSLKAAGLSPSQAREKAEANAAALVDNAAEIKKTMLQPTVAGPGVATNSPEARRARMKAMLEAASSGKEKPKSLAERLASGPVGMLLGYRTRLLAGCLLVAGGLLWMNQNGLIPGRELKELAETAQKPIDRENGTVVDAAKAQQLASGWMDAYQKAAPLNVPVVGGLFSSFNPLVAGLLLVFSAFIPGLRIAAFVFPAAAIALFGGAFMPDWIALVAGAGLGVLGLVFGRTGN